MQKSTVLYVVISGFLLAGVVTVLLRQHFGAGDSIVSPEKKESVAEQVESPAADPNSIDPAPSVGGGGTSRRGLPSAVKAPGRYEEARESFRLVFPAQATEIDECLSRLPADMEPDLRMQTESFLVSTMDTMELAVFIESLPQEQREKVQEQRAMLLDDMLKKAHGLADWHGAGSYPRSSYDLQVALMEMMDASPQLSLWLDKRQKTLKQDSNQN